MASGSLKKVSFFLVLSVKYKETPRLLGIFHFRYPRFLQKVELPEPTTDSRTTVSPQM